MIQLKSNELYHSRFRSKFWNGDWPRSRYRSSYLPITWSLFDSRSSYRTLSQYRSRYCHGCMSFYKPRYNVPWKI